MENGMVLLGDGCKDTPTIISSDLVKNFFRDKDSRGSFIYMIYLMECDILAGLNKSWMQTFDICDVQFIFFSRWDLRSTTPYMPG